MSFFVQTAGQVGQIVLFGLLLGAGLPAIFALGLKALSPRAALAPVASTGASVPASEVSVGRKLVAGLCFAVVVAAVVTAIVFLIVTGHR